MSSSCFPPGLAPIILTVRCNHFSRQSIFPAQIQWHSKVPSVIADRDLVRKWLCTAGVWINLRKVEGWNKTSVTLSHGNNSTPRSELDWLRGETYLCVAASLAPQEVILRWSFRLGFKNYASDGRARPPDGTECIHRKAAEEEKETNCESVRLTTSAIGWSWKSTFRCTERRQCVQIKKKKSQAQVLKFGSSGLSGYGFNQNNKKKKCGFYLPCV